MTGWASEPLGSLCELLSGLWKGKEPPFQTARVIRNTNFNPDGTLDDADIAVLEVESKQFGKRELRSGDIILEKSGGGPKQPVGRVIFFDRNESDFSFSNFTSAIRIKNAKRLDAKFLHKYLFWIYKSGFTETIQSHSTGIRNLNLNAYKLIEVPLPPLEEQRRIVAVLDEAFAGLATMRANAEANVRNARALFESHLNAIFSQRGEGWVETTLEATCSIKSKLVDPREAEFLDLPHIGAGNMISKTGEIVDIKTAREEKLISGKFLFDQKTVLYSKIRPYLMKSCTPDFVGLCSADVYPLTPNTGKLDRSFLFHLLMSQDFTAYAIQGSDRAGMPKVNRDHLFAYRFWVPPLTVQESLSRVLDDLSIDTTRLEALYRQKLAAIDELKQSILHRAFSGQLTATDDLAA